MVEFMGKSKFKPLIEEFSLLNNLRIELLANEVDRSLYKEKFMSSYSYERDIEISDTEYNKNAFVHKLSSI